MPGSSGSLFPAVSLDSGVIYQYTTNTWGKEGKHRCQGIYGHRCQGIHGKEDGYREPSGKGGGER